MASPTSRPSAADTRPPVSLRSPSVVVHLEYDSTSLPPVPSPEWTRFVCISHTHSRMISVPPGDVLLHSGDLTAMGTFYDFQLTMKWLADLPHRTKM